MAVNDAAVYLPGKGKIWVAAPGTAAPADPTDPGADVAWSEMGHTSREEGVTISRDGGDSETLGTWQNPSLRERRETVTYSITAQAHQVDNTVLGLYFGDTDESTAGVLAVTGDSPTTDKALFIQIIDGADEVGLYVPKVSIGADDDVELDVEALMAFPLRCTVLKETGSNLLEFFADNLGAQV